MEFTKNEGTSGILACLDFEKAFDSIEWDTIFRCLEVFAFGPIFRRWVSVLYTDVSSFIRNNGLHSGYFILERGVRQGDPLSPYIFMTVIELLAIAIRAKDNIRGICLGESEIKLVQRDYASLKKFLELLKSFEKKSECMGVGEARRRKGDLFGLNWPARPIKCLGVYLTYDYDFIKMNYKQRLKKLENTTNWWKGRGLTLFGRAQVINSLLLPKLIYIARMFVVPEEIIKEINKIAFKFLWRGQDRVVRTAIINLYENGGLRVLDSETLLHSLHLSWLNRLCNGEEAGWKSYLNYLLKPYRGSFLFYCDYDPKDLKLSNAFYAELIKFWADFRQVFSETNRSISVIWNNKNITIDGKLVCYKTFFDKNIVSIRQLSLLKCNLESLDNIKNETNIKCNFLQWAGLRATIPIVFRGKEDDVRKGEKLGFYYNNTFFDVAVAKCKHYYSMLIELKGTLPYGAKRLQQKVNVTRKELPEIYFLPNEICMETFLRDFQFKILNNITRIFY